MITIALIGFLFIGFIFLGIPTMFLVLSLDEQDKRYEEIKHKTNKMLENNKC